MKFPLSSLRPQSVFKIAAAAFALSYFGVLSLCAQDRLFLKNNTVVDGKVAEMKDGAVVVNVATTSGAGQMSYNLGLINKVEVSPPASFQSGMSAYQAGNWDKALADLKLLADQFHGLPTEWARQSAAVLGDVYIEKNDLPKAEAAYNDFRRFYPGTGADSLRLSVGQAHIAFAKNNAVQARQQLQALTQAAMKNPALVTRLDGAAYGQAFYLLGQIDEKEGKIQDALDNYLHTVTLFYQDGAVTPKAQHSADALRAAHKDLTVP